MSLKVLTPWLRTKILGYQDVIREAFDGDSLAYAILARSEHVPEMYDVDVWDDIYGHSPYSSEMALPKEEAKRLADQLLREYGYYLL